MAALYGLLVIDEYYFRWEEGRRQSFRVERSNLPLFRRFGEDYLVEPVTTGSCRFTWTIAADPTQLGRAMAPLTKSNVRGLFADTRRHFR